MSIERIKELLELIDNVKDLPNVEDISMRDELLINLSKIIIEEHEQKKPFAPSDSTSINDAILGNTVEEAHNRLNEARAESTRLNGINSINNAYKKAMPELEVNTVEVEQIWRTNGHCKHLEIMAVRPGEAVAKYGEINGGVITDLLRTDDILAMCELVTMENIKEGEWVERIETKTEHDLETYTVGKKYKTYISSWGLCIESDDLKSNRRIETYKDMFKPCLPMEEETKEPTFGKSPIVEEIKRINKEREEYANECEKQIELGMKFVEELFGFNKKLYTQEQLDKACEETKEYHKNKHENKIIQRDKRITKLEAQLENSENTFKQRHKNELDKADKEAELRGVNKGGQEVKELNERVAELINQNSTAYSEGFKEGKSGVRDANKMNSGELAYLLEIKRREETMIQAQCFGYIG